MAEVSRVAADASLPVAAPTNSAATRSKSAPSNEDILLCVDVGVAELDEPITHALRDHELHRR